MKDEVNKLHDIDIRPVRLSFFGGFQ